MAFEVVTGAASAAAIEVVSEVDEAVVLPENRAGMRPLNHLCTRLFFDAFF